MFAHEDWSRKIMGYRKKMSLLAVGLLGLGMTSRTSAQTPYTWNDSNSDWTNAAAWNPVGPNWADYARLFDSSALFGPAATITNQPNITGLLYTNGLSLNNSGGGIWAPTGTGVLAIGSGGLTVTGGGTSVIGAGVRVVGNQTWTVGTTTVVHTNNSLTGFGTITKAGSGTLIIDPLASGAINMFTGTIVVDGTLQIGGTTAIDLTGSAFRNVNIDFGAATATVNAVRTGGSNADLRAGTISGSSISTVTLSGSAPTYNMLALNDASYAGTFGTPGTQLTVRGGAGNVQTLTGTTTNLAGTLGINSAVGVTLANNATFAGTTLAMRGGNFTLDNSAVNNTNRVSDTTNITMLGGGSLVRLIGNSTGTTETVGAISFNAGSHTIQVDHNGGVPGTALTITDGGTLRDSTAMTMNFIGTGGTLGDPLANPRIRFTGTIFTGTAGLLANTAGGVTIGFARYNSTEWAGFDATNGIVRVAPTATPTDSTGLSALTSISVAVFSPTGLVTSTGFSTATLKITPAGGTTLSLTGNLNTNAVMLDSAGSYSIIGGALTGGATRYMYVVQPSSVLNFSGSFGFTSSLPLTKGGAGTLNLTGVSAQLTATSATAITVTQGTLRGTTTSLGGGGSNGAPFTTLNLFGGVLEISGGGSLTRTLASTGVTAPTAGGGIIQFNASGTSRGDGGFAAIGGAATVTLVTTIGGSTPATPTWDATGFISNGYALLFNSPDSDSAITLTNDLSLTTATNYFAREVRVALGQPGAMAILSGTIIGGPTIDFLKTGEGRLTFSGGNTYTGNTLVRQGTLFINGNQTAATGTTVVYSGATLAGTGTLGGAVQQTAGSILAPGLTAGAGTLTVNAPVMLDSGATIAYDINQAAPLTSILSSGGSSIVGGQDQITITGTGNGFRAGAITLALTELVSVIYNPLLPYSFVVATGQIPAILGSATINTAGAPAAAAYITGGGLISLQTSGNTVYLNFNPVPEPTTSLALAGLMLAAWRRRKSRESLTVGERQA
jgi:fibronectin-binding autotransporter adhesin